MSRNGAGVYTLPSNSFNPAVTSTPISSDAWNQTATDLATALTYSIAADGQTPTTVRIPFAQGIKVNNGAVGNPAINFASDLTSGLYLVTAGQVGITAAGVQALLATATGISIPGALAVTGVISGPTISAASTSLSQISASLSSTNSTQALISSSLANVSTSLNNVSSSVTANAGVSTSVSQISSSLSTTNSTVAVLSATVSQVSSSLSTTNSTVTVLSTTVSGVSSSLSTTNSTVTVLSTSVAGLNTSLSTTNSNVTKVSTSLANVSTSLANVSTSLGSALSGTAPNSIGFLGSPLNTQNTTYTLQQSDDGKTILNNSGGTENYTVPSTLSVGTIIVIAAFNQVNLVQGSGCTLAWAGTAGTTGSRVIGAGGILGMATIESFGSFVVVSGVGIT